MSCLKCANQNADAAVRSASRGALLRRQRASAISATILLAVVLGTGLLLYAVDPAGVAWLPKCPLHQITGWHCPGCGVTRAAHALLHGDLLGAFNKNALLLFLTPLLLLYCGWKRRREGRAWSTTISRRAILGLLALLLLFAVLRNIPVYPFELLAPH
jgi:hypothetical protein